MRLQFFFFVLSSKLFTTAIESTPQPATEDRADRCLMTLTHCDLKVDGLGVTAVGYSPDGRIVAAGSYEFLRLWSDEGVELSSERGNDARVASLVFSRGSDSILVGRRDFTVNICSV